MDLERIEALLKLLGEHKVGEFHYKDAEHSIKLSFNAKNGCEEPAPTMELIPAPVVELRNIVTVESPMVGVFYRAASPDSPPFVELKSRVSPGTAICIVEAMKLMNEIEAEVTGEVVEILVDDAQPVEFGQPLFRIEIE